MESSDESYSSYTDSTLSDVGSDPNDNSPEKLRVKIEGRNLSDGNDNYACGVSPGCLRRKIAGSINLRAANNQGNQVGDVLPAATPGDKTNATQLMNGAINYSITTTVHEENVFNYGQFTQAINFGNAGLALLGEEECGPAVVLKTNTAAMYLSEYESSGTAVNSVLLLVDATKILDYDGERQEIPYGQIDSDGSGNIHASLRFTGRVKLNNGRNVDSCYGKDLLLKTDSCRKVDWHVPTIL